MCTFGSVSDDRNGFRCMVTQRLASTREEGGLVCRLLADDQIQLHPTSVLERKKSSLSYDATCRQKDGTGNGARQVGTSTRFNVYVCVCVLPIVVVKAGRRQGRVCHNFSYSKFSLFLFQFERNLLKLSNKRLKWPIDLEFKQNVTNELINVAYIE